MTQTPAAQAYRAQVRQKRKFLPIDFEIQNWEQLKPYYEQLLQAPIDDVNALENWLKNWSELEAVAQEEEGWRYIRRSCHTDDQALQAAYEYFVLNISPQLARYHNAFNEKYYHAPSRSALDKQKYRIFDIVVAKDIEIFKEENVDLLAEIEVEAQEYDKIAGSLSIELNGERLTLQQAAAHLESPDRNFRAQVWAEVTNQRLSVSEKLDQLFDKLLQLRQQVAQNAGFSSYSDYKFKALGRFDYTRQDCEAFHTAIEKVVTPIYTQILQDRTQKMGLSALRPWDLAPDPEGRPPLKSFSDGTELLDKTIQLFKRLDPKLGAMITQMRELGHFDVSSRLGKAPGGYNYPLYESGVPFIFMNAAGTQSDLTTMVHECGHAIHSFVTHDLELNAFKDTPSEIAELASMSMELISMPLWDIFYTDASELKRAHRQQISRSITGLPWIATVDCFQYWLYDHPNHSAEARRNAWCDIYERFHGTAPLDWSGYQAAYQNLWQRQLHLYHVPFYYIEYGFAQLGAFQVWRNYLQDPQGGLAAYLNGLRLGYTRSIPETYQAAGVAFDFSTDFVAQLFQFIEQAMGGFVE